MPKNRIVRRPAARVDVVEIAVYLGTEATPEIADRFVAALARAYERLAAMPHIGSPYRSTKVGLRNLRKWPVPGFSNHLIFYRPIADGVEVIRVLHASRDLIRLLELE